jgi:hypothetical protein
MSIQSKAKRDAREYARALMFYGDGAGTRRKLIQATVDARSHKSPTYARVFRAELANQDMAAHASKARFERGRKDAAEAIGRNVKALVSGRYEKANTTLLIVIVGGYLAHHTGLDKAAYDKSQELYAKYKNRRAVKRILKDTTPKNY